MLYIAASVMFSVMSGNDVATAIATHVGGKIDPASADPYGTFIKAMNDRAAQLGCTDTLFENPHGLDFGAWVGNLHSLSLIHIWTSRCCTIKVRARANTMMVVSDIPRICLLYTSRCV